MPPQPLYDLIGQEYAGQRRADPRIAAAIDAALAAAAAVLNVGAGAGSYEPSDRRVVAVEPSRVMIAQRPRGSGPAVRGRAESLPFSDAAFDAVLIVLTLHHWSDQLHGLRECARVARDRVVVLTYDPAAADFWLTQHYFPEFNTLDRKRFSPSMDVFSAAFGAQASIEIVPVPIPRDCVDGFLGAFWARPEAYLDARVRAGISSFAYCDAEAGLSRLRSDLADGTWSTHFGHLLAMDALDIGYRLVIARVSARCAA